MTDRRTPGDSKDRAYALHRAVKIRRAAAKTVANLRLSLQLPSLELYTLLTDYKIWVY